MGGENSVLLARLAEDPEELENELRKKHKTSEDNVRKHGWDEKDKSPNIDVLDDCQLAKKTSNVGNSDGIRGRIGYKGGVFLFEFEWRPGKDKHVVVGLSTTKAPLTCIGRRGLIGANEYSIGWDLVHRCIRFNDCKIKSYPNEDSREIPSKITMILDMTDGTLSFRAGSRDYGVAMKGLKHLANAFYVAASLDEPNDTIRITYLGSLDTIKKSLSISSNGGLRFHETCGQNIKLSNGNCTADRVNSDETHMFGTVLTHRPLKEGETFTVRCDARDKRRKGAWVVGATTVKPEELDFPKEMTRCKQGKRWLYNEDKILFQNKKEHEVNANLDDLRSGDKVGVKRCDGEFHFLVNGERIARVKAETDEEVYGVVDVFGRTIKVSLLDEDGHSPKREGASSKKATSIDASALLHGILPRTHDEYLSRLHSTIEKLKDKDPSTIADVRRLLKVNLILPFAAVKSARIRKEAAEKLGEIKDTAKLIFEYMMFLWELGLETDEHTEKAFMHLLTICQNYGNESLLLSKQFGECGLMKWFIQELARMKDSYTQHNRELQLVKKYLGILCNFAKAPENRPIFREYNFLDIAKIYTEASSNDTETSTVATVTMSYVCDDDQTDSLQVPEEIVKNLTHILRKSVENAYDDRVPTYDGWHCNEIAVGITNLCRNPENVDKFVKEGTVTHLVKMLSVVDSYGKECALNCIWSMTTDGNRSIIIKSGGLSLKLKALGSDGNEGVRQAAVRLLTRLVKSDEHGLESVHLEDHEEYKCNYKSLCDRYMQSLNIPGEYFDKTKDECCCAECHGLRGDDSYHYAGDPPKRYGVPVGWCCFGLSLPPRAKVHNIVERWHRAYHGTKQEHIEGILNVGEIIPAGKPVLGGKKIKEGSGHFNSMWKPSGFNTKKVFLSPSIRYAGIDTYARPSIFVDSLGACTYIAKVAFEVCIAPGCYDVDPQTVGAHTYLDPGFSNQELEWSTVQHGSCILHGLLVKLKEED